MSEELARAQRELDEKKLRHNSLVAVDAVVSAFIRGMAQLFLIGIVALIGLFVLWGFCKGFSEHSSFANPEKPYLKPGWHETSDGRAVPDKS